MLNATIPYHTIPTFRYYPWTLDMHCFTWHQLCVCLWIWLYVSTSVIYRFSFFLFLLILLILHNVYLFDFIMFAYCGQEHTWKQTLIGQQLETFPFIPGRMLHVEWWVKDQQPRSALCLTHRISLLVQAMTSLHIDNHKYPVQVIVDWPVVVSQHTEAPPHNHPSDRHSQSSSRSGMIRIVDIRILLPRRRMFPEELAAMKMFTAGIR